MKYFLKDADERYQYISKIGDINIEGGYKLTNEPFDIENFEFYRYDKNIGQWVAGLIKKNGNWVRGDSIEGQLLDKWRKLKNRLGIDEQE